MKLGLLLSELVAAQELCEHYEISNECIQECTEVQTSCLGKGALKHKLKSSFDGLIPPHRKLW